MFSFPDWEEVPLADIILTLFDSNRMEKCLPHIGIFVLVLLRLPKRLKFRISQIAQIIRSILRVHARSLPCIINDHPMFGRHTICKMSANQHDYIAFRNYKEYLSLQCDAALRNIVRVYPYDVAPNVDTTGDGQADEGSLRGSSEVVAARIRDEIQAKVADAGLEIIEARITYLAYAPEIAAVMLQRQQASAIIDARKMIVDGAVGMVEMALERLAEKGTVELDEERKAAMVSNLLVVLCGNHDAQPVVNSGSLY